MNIDDPAKRAQLHRLQSDLLILESDAKKMNRQKEDLMMIIKKSKIQAERLRMEIFNKEQEMKKMDRNLYALNGDIFLIKKKIKLL